MTEIIVREGKGFMAQAQGKCDHEVEVIAVRNGDTKENMMCVCTEQAAIYITKEQACEFFDLTPK